MATVRDSREAELPVGGDSKRLTHDLPTIVVVPSLLIDPARSYILTATNYREGDKTPSGRFGCEDWIYEWGGIYKTAHQVLCKTKGIEEPCTPYDADHYSSSWETDRKIYKNPYGPSQKWLTNPDYSHYPEPPIDLELEEKDTPDCSDEVDALEDYSGARKHEPRDYEHRAVDNQYLIRVELCAYRMRCELAFKPFRGDKLPRFVLDYDRRSSSGLTGTFLAIQYGYTYMLVIEAVGVNAGSLDALDDLTLAKLGHAVMCKEVGIPSGVVGGPDLDTFRVGDVSPTITLHMFPSLSKELHPATRSAFDHLRTTCTGRRAAKLSVATLVFVESAAAENREKICRIVQK